MKLEIVTIYLTSLPLSLVFKLLEIGVEISQNPTPSPLQDISPKKYGALQLPMEWSKISSLTKTWGAMTKKMIFIFTV